MTPENMLVPVVYIGEKPYDEANVLGIIWRFQRHVPRHIELRFANILLNRANYQHASTWMMNQFRDPVEYVHTILVARTLHSLGDMLYASVTPKALRRRYPNAKIDVCIPRESFPVWKFHPHVDSLIACDEVGTKPGKYDVYWDITRPCVRFEMANPREIKTRIDIYMEHCGVQLPDDEKQPIYTITDEERKWAEKETGGRFFFGIQMRANSPDRNWQPGTDLKQDRNVEMAMRMLKHTKDVDVAMFDQHAEFMDAKAPKDKRVFKVAGYGVRETMAILERCVTVLTLNSGMLVASGALSVPQVSLFGNINPACRIPYLPEAKAIWHPEECPTGQSPCWGVCGFPKCMDGIKVDEVWEAIKERFETAGRRRLDALNKYFGGMPWTTSHSKDS